jgi:hypothetical protein
MTQRPPPDAAAGPLPPFDPAPLAADYPPAEAAALSAALGCPDLFLIDAPGRGHLVADLAAEAARAGRRVLVVAPGPAADAVVDRLADLGDIVGRAVAPGEAVELLTRAAAARTAAAVGESAVADAVRRAADAVAEASAKLAGLNPEGVADRLARVAADEAAAHADKDRADADAEACPEAAALRARQAADRDAAVARLRAELDEAVAAAKKRHGAVGFLKGLFAHDDPAVKCADLQRRLAAAEESATPPDPDHRAELEALIRSEADRRRTDADGRLAALLVERGRLAGLEEQARAADAEVRAARGVVVDPAAAAAGALARVRVAVGPAAAAGNDPFVPADATFDLLVVGDAEHLTDPEFDAVTRRAGQRVLVGDVSAPVRPGRPFAREWQRLHRRPFAVEAGRFVARLFDAPRSARLRAEPLADRPQVELRFARTPDGGVGVAEVAFPGHTQLTAAKAFLSAELGEVRLTVAGPVHWHEADDRLTACWPAFDGPRGGWADLGDGVRERVAGPGPDAPTALVSFDKSSGWDRASAEEWVAHHAEAARSARTLALPRPAAEPAAPARVLATVGG